MIDFVEKGFGSCYLHPSSVVCDMILYPFGLPCPSWSFLAHCFCCYSTGFVPMVWPLFRTLMVKLFYGAFWNVVLWGFREPFEEIFGETYLRVLFWWMLLFTCISSFSESLWLPSSADLTLLGFKFGVLVFSLSPVDLTPLGVKFGVLFFFPSFLFIPLFGVFFTSSICHNRNSTMCWVLLGLIKGASMRDKVVSEAVLLLPKIVWDSHEVFECQVWGKEKFPEKNNFGRRHPCFMKIQNSSFWRM